MNTKKVIVLIAIILVIAVIAIVVGINLSRNNEETNTVQNEANSGNELENGEVAETQNNSEENTQVAQDNQEEEVGKALVLYFSHTGNTENVANFIHEAVGGDIIKLETEEPYTDNYDELLDIAQEEKNETLR